MSLLVNCQNLRKSFGTRSLFKQLNLSIFSRDRIGLIGPNGSGKSTLLKILAGQEASDEGIVSVKRGISIGYVPQSCEFPKQSLKSILLEACGHRSEIPSYEQERLADEWLTRFGFSDPNVMAADLSGGWKKRLSFAQAFISSPDILLLDEPTNHLDLESILWLESILKRHAQTYVLVSHDRYFLQNTVNRVVEIDKVYASGLFAIEGSYSQFLAKKEEFLLGQMQQERSAASKMRHEIEWAKQSPKARTTKSRARLENAEQLEQNFQDIRERNRQRRADISFAATERETRKLLAAKNIAKSIQGRELFSKLDLTLSPKTRLGLMGPNGSGKTTLLRILAGQIQPDQGTIKQADDLKIVYFDQHRLELSGDLTLREALSPTGEYVEFRGQRIHVNGWCKRFLFSPDLLDLRLRYLSGGEKARIAIAHLMLQPADLLLLDEPTNDLDIPTLEALEETLLEFPGAIVLITHDRCMMDRVCNDLLSLNPGGKVQFYADYAQWAAARPASLHLEAQIEKQVALQPKDSSPKKLTYLEKKEYEQIEGRIAALEQKLCELNRSLESEEALKDSSRLHSICQEIEIAQTQIEQLYLRWHELDEKSH